MKQILLFIITIAALNINAQHNIFVKKEVQKAIKNGTRTTDGVTGENYWQNTADYKIKAEFNPETNQLKGSEIITYKNNSPDELQKIVIKLYQDLFKKGSSRDWDVGPSDIHKGVKINSMKIRNTEVDLNSREIRRSSTLMYVGLDQSIQPGEEINIEIDWELKIPKYIPIRMGTYEGENFMIAYWYPRIAVYDDIDGWQSIPHTGSCEYYNDYGNYEVEITMPDNYLVWSSGKLQNAEELFTKSTLKKLKKASKSDKIVNIITKEDLDNGIKILKKPNNTFKFKVNNMPDFAFAASKTYLWDATSVDLGTKRVDIHAVYKQNSPDFNKVADLSYLIIKYFSNEIPAIEFPYEHLVAFNGRGGMEFPGMINDGSASSWNGTLYVTSHEIGHSYFPFNVGTNEQQYAWIDEGLITYFPRKVVAEFTNDTDYVFAADIIDMYNKKAAGKMEIPLMVNSTNSRISYRYQAYNKSSIAFFTLNKYLGDEKFYKALQIYTDNWKSKHPTPYDLFNCFEKAAEEDLDWFWKPWFFELGYADLALEKTNENDNTYFIDVVNKGGYPVEIDITIEYLNGDKNSFTESAAIWKDGKTNYTLEIPKNKVKSIKLNTLTVPDVFPEDNKLYLK